MSIITATDLHKSFGPEVIFSGVSLAIPPRARAAIVGPNGIGKTTLLKILAGEEKPTAGTVHLAKSARLGYLPQEVGRLGGTSLWEHSLEALADLRQQETRLADLAAEMKAQPGNEELLARYGRVQQAFEHAGGFTYVTTIQQVLTGLGFDREDYEMPLDHLSGGQRTRAWLARLLLSRPDLLILDEPTNHLDIQAVEWLESYLRGWDGAVLMVSHDRYFIDQVVNFVYEMSRTGFETYRGNYTHYLQQREMRWEERRQFYASELARMSKELDFIRRNIAGQRVQMAKGKLSRLSRDILAVEQLGFDGVRGKKWSQMGVDGKVFRVEEAAQRLAALEVPDNSLKSLNLHIRPKYRSGNLVLRAENLTIGYPGNPLFSVSELELGRRECAALIGPNGSGKTTFLKTLLGRVEPLDGEFRTGASLKIGYFAQAHAGLSADNTLIEEIDAMGTGMLVKDIRGYLGRFLFSGEDHYKQVSVLSGGERGRLALAKLGLLDANFLLLDEPSNHLDIPGQEILQQVLTDFDGTILMVSHDRYLIDALATQIWDIDVEEKQLEIFKGTFGEYRGLQADEPQPADLPDQNGDTPAVEGAEQSRKSQILSKFERRRIENRITQLEDRIILLEDRLETISRKLQEGVSDSTEIQSLGEDYAYLESELKDAMAEWEAEHTRLTTGETP